MKTKNNHFLGGALELHKAIKQNDRPEVKRMAKKYSVQVRLSSQHTCFGTTGKRDKYHCSHCSESKVSGSEFDPNAEVTEGQPW